MGTIKYMTEDGKVHLNKPQEEEENIRYIISDGRVIANKEEAIYSQKMIDISNILFNGSNYSRWYRLLGPSTMKELSSLIVENEKELVQVLTENT